MELRTEQSLDKVRDVILKTVDVNAMYLFGSYAYGQPRADSDFDIYVVVPDDCVLRPIEAMQKIHRALFGVQDHPTDILVGRESRFNQRRTQPTIERTIFNQGMMLYGKQ